MAATGFDQIKWNVGTATLDPTRMARFKEYMVEKNSIYDELNYVDVTAFDDPIRKYVPIRQEPRPRGTEVEDGIFVEREENKDYAFGRTVIRYRADFSRWQGDKKDIYIPNAGALAKRAGFDTIMAIEVQKDMGISPRDIDQHEIYRLVERGKQELTDKLLDFMGTSRAKVIGDYYEKYRGTQSEYIIPDEVHNGFLDQKFEETRKLYKARLVRQRELEEASKIARQLDEMIEEEAEEAAAEEVSDLFGAWA